MANSKLPFIYAYSCSGTKVCALVEVQCLIYHANKSGFCLPSIQTIAAEGGYGLSTIKRALNDLCEAGYIEKLINQVLATASNGSTGENLILYPLEPNN